MMRGRTHQPSPSSPSPLPAPPPPPPPALRRQPQQPHLDVDFPTGMELVGKEEDGTSYPREEAGRASRSSRGKAVCGVRERNRREKMTEKYVVLQSMVPNLFPRATKARIVEETINFIEELEETIRVMEAAKKAKRKARMSSTGSSVEVTISGKMAFFGVSSVWRPGLAASVLRLFDVHNAEVLAATIASHNGGQSTSGGGQNMNLSITVMADETAVEALEEALMTMLS